MAILIALAFGLLFLLIAMVVNIGFLVATKINLQNATDLAAYAGAAQQARYLSEIGKWNYEMRRNYKAMAFDYMIVLNGERRYNKTKANTNPSDIDFRDYMVTSTDKPKGIPWVCATLQRQGRSVKLGDQSLSTTCQNSQFLNFETAIQSSANALNLSLASQGAACINGGDPVICAGITIAAHQQAAADTSLSNTANDTDDKLANYEKYPYNYNRRLIAWMLHDYRHLQARIRGVHFGDISLGQYSNTNPFARSSGRWALQKEQKPAPVIFENSPISVASKVINGYTQTSGAPPTANIIAIAPGETLKNPVHNAAYGTFKKNLMEVLYDSAKLYTLVPKSNAGGSTSSNSMAGGCGSSCQEFNGPYLKLDNHDVDFWVTYSLVKKRVGVSQYDYDYNMEPVTGFPVGVAKDMRVATYYTVVGTASTKNIPFNVFFGSGESSQAATMVAVAAARPFGSRIGPFLDEKCDNLHGKAGADKAACEKNGLDYLYPFESSQAQVLDKIPNFSLVGPIDEQQKLGVKLCVDKTEYQQITADPLWGTTTPAAQAAIGTQLHTTLYQEGSGQNSRWRTYVRPVSSGPMNGDDGFQTRPTTAANNPSGPSAYFDSDQDPVHPFGTKDSVIAWNGLSIIKPLDTAKKNNYETYLDNYRGAAMYQFGTQVPDRKSGSQDYKVYVFRYPDRTNSKWDINNQVKSGGNDSKMERAFANAMAVSQFEISRYIIPYRNDPNPTQGSAPSDVLNYIANDANDKAFIFGGTKDRDIAPLGTGDIPFGGPSASGPNNMIKGEGQEVFGVKAAGDVFAETYAAWRFGSRGYRVKLVNIQDLIGSTKGLQNPLETRYTLPDSGITVDLSSIQY